MKVHPRFKKDMLKDIFTGIFLLLVGLFSLLYLAYEFSTMGLLIATFFFSGCSLGILLGIRVLADAIPFHELLTHLVENNIAAEEMAVTIRVESSSGEWGTTYFDCADLRFLGDDPDPSPAITLRSRHSQSWTKDIVPGTRAKVYGARSNEGPVVIETEKGFIWPAGRRSTQRRKVPKHSLNTDAPKTACR